MKKPADAMECELANLAPQTRYRVKIYACGAFQKETLEPLTLELETLAEDLVDRNAVPPRADVLAVDFEYDSQTAKITPDNFSQRSVAHVHAQAPEIVKDEQFGDLALFNGVDQAIILPFNSLKVAAIQNEISIGVRFKLDGAKANARCSIFGSTESEDWVLNMIRKKRRYSQGAGSTKNTAISKQRSQATKCSTLI